jgi:L-lactate dehydrogenase complex protein LldG
VSARDAILAAVRRAAVPAVELPELPAPRPAAPGAASGAELVRRFCEMLEEVGGRAVELSGAEALASAVAGLPAAEAAKANGRGIVSCVPGLAISTLTLGPDASRARLDEIELAIIPGLFGVAENAAVWVSEEDLPHRALPFVAQHLAIVLSKGEIVADMHAAYRRLPRPLPGYGVFISGPSKTADIEQALVIGAQGPKSLVVFLV